MKLRNLIRCHLSYLLSRSSKIIIGLIILMLAILFLSNSIASNYNSVSDNVNNYYLSSITIFKIIYVTLGCFIVNNFFNYKNDAYICLIIIGGIKKEKYFITKIISIFIVLIIVIFVLFLLFLFFGFILIQGFVFEMRFIETFIWTYIISSIYMLYALIISLVLNNNFGFLIPSFVSILMQALVEGKISIIKKTLFIIFPVLNNNLNRGYFHISVYVLISIILFIISGTMYSKLDRKSE